jgi:outer membrane receptor for Fe3+-dicitrate
VLESGNLNGYQIKGGAVRNLSQEWSVFGNAGFVSKVPILDGVIDDVNAVKIDDPKNEKFISFEVGTQFRSMDRAVSFDFNLYHTTWRDRTLNLFVRNLSGTGEDGAVRLLGVEQRHMGVEIETAWQPSDDVRFDVAASIGDWEYTDDVSGQFISDDRNTTYDYDFYLDGLKVADSPQQQLTLTTSFFPATGLTLSAVGRFYRNYFAEFSPASRCIGDVVEADACATRPGTPAADEVLERNQPWKTPGYSVFDVHFSYSLSQLIPIASGGDLRLFANVYNIFNQVFVQDAIDNSAFNGYDLDHDADDAEVFLGTPRNVNLGFQVTF